MAERSHVPFDVFAMRVEVPVSTAVRDGGLGWTCGQCPLTDQGAVHASGDLLAQAGFVCDMIENVMERAGFSPSSVGKLHVYFAAETEREASDMLAVIATRFDHGPLVVPIPVPHFYYDGMLIEVDVFAADNLKVHAPFEADGVRLEMADAGDQVWVHASASLAEGTSAGAVDRIAGALARHGLDHRHLLGDLWTVSGSDNDAREAARNAQRRQLTANPDALVRPSDPAVPVIAAALSFARQPVAVLTDVKTDDGVRLTLKKSGRMVWGSGTCAQSNLDLVGQTSMIMQGLDTGLRASGMSFADVVKLTAHYTGGATEQELHGNMKVRHGFYASPGPASTGLPVAGLGNGKCRMAVNVVALSS
ncbi:Rid family hydrolase [Anderseniella sp. Alg231-50]|uniref:Rid family hydrolase n=1 Tax=Anderseniella sp. Alg231-50 TaxID=1922226 RepID=UPI000D55C44A